MHYHLSYHHSPTNTKVDKNGIDTFVASEAELQAETSFSLNDLCISLSTYGPDIVKHPNVALDFTQRSSSNFRNVTCLWDYYYAKASSKGHHANCVKLRHNLGQGVISNCGC